MKFFENQPSPVLNRQLPSLVEVIHSSLLLDGESVYSLVTNPLLLLLARVILAKCSPKMNSLQVNLSPCRNLLFVVTNRWFV